MNHKIVVDADGNILSTCYTTVPGAGPVPPEGAQVVDVTSDPLVGDVAARLMTYDVADCCLVDQGSYL